MSKTEDVRPAATFRHYKGKEYTIICIATEESTMRKLVIYRANYGKKQIWARPLDNFLRPVRWPDGAIRSRFHKLEGD